MIKTFKAANGSNAMMGNVQVQPVTSDVEHSIKLGTASTVKGSTPVSESQLGISTVLMGDGGTSVDSTQSMGSIAKSVISNDKFIMPAMESKTNTIASSLASSKAHTGVTGVPLKKRSDVEERIGVSETRPEIVMMTNYLPLFDKATTSSNRLARELDDSGTYANMTDAGRFVDTHLSARNLRHADAVKLVKRTRQNFAKADAELEKKKQKFEAAVSDMEAQASFMLGLVRNLHRLKGQLDLRDDIHITDVERTVTSFTKRRGKGNNTPLRELTQKHLPTTFSISDALQRLGYKDTNIEKYASTKVWMQLLHELKDVLMFHSNDFIDASVVAQKNDKSTSTILKSRTRHFGFKNQDTVPASQLGQVTPEKVSQTVSSLMSVWDSLYENISFKTDEARLGALASIISKEYRYSRALGQTDTRKLLSEKFGYDATSTDNVRMFDAIIGNIGSDITDSSPGNDSSLVSIAQQRPSRTLTVLTFESKNIDDGDETLEPGSSYYVDSVLDTTGQEFSTGRLESLAKQFMKAHESFDAVATSLDLITVGDDDDASSTQFFNTLADPTKFITALISDMVNVNNGETVAMLRNDNLGAVYALASKNNKLKTMMFLYTITRLMSRSRGSTNDILDSQTSGSSEDNTPTTNELVEKIVDHLMNSVKQVKSGAVNNAQTISITRASIKSCLKHGTVLSRFIESVFTQVYLAFKASGKTTIDNQRFNAGGGATVDARTRYGDHVDTVIMMATYDLITQLIVKYGNQSIVSLNPGNSPFNTTTFTISRTNVNHKSSINDLTVRLEKETSLVNKLMFCVLNTLERLSESFTGYVSFLSSRTSKTYLQKISDTIGDPTLVKLALGEQQIMVLSSAVKDMRDMLLKKRSIPTNTDIDGDGSLEADDVVQLLDDSVVLPKLRDALYGLMGTQEFASKKGYNKKLMTVGLPLGFTENLKQRVNIANLKRTSFVDKQSDIVNLSVYKVDLQNSDIIYKPVRYLFEVSRFPVRNDEHFIDIPPEPSLNDVVSSVPTRDFGNDSDGNLPTYWSLSGDDMPRSRKPSFAAESYAFLSSAQKNELAKNHVTSYLCEVYTKLLTGIDLADYHFDIVDVPRLMNEDTARVLVNNHIASVAMTSNVASQKSQSSGGVLFGTTATKASGASHGRSLSNPAGKPGAVQTRQNTFATTSTVTKTLDRQDSSTRTLDDNLAGLTLRSSTAALHGLRTASNLTHSLTSVSAPELVAKKFVSPKQFDRVFTLVVDPDDFEIDYDKTVKTLQGKQSLEMLIKTGDIIPASENDRTASRAKRSATVVVGSRGFPQSRSSFNLASYRFRDRDRNSGDLTFEKYFVTVETFGEEQD